MPQGVLEKKSGMQVWLPPQVSGFAFVHLRECLCVLVGRLGIPSVSIAVPSFHASAASRESSSLGSLSVVFNERALHHNAA